MLDLVKLEKALKIRYSEEEVINMAYDDEPFLALVPKSEKFGGKSYQYDLILENPQNASSDFAVGQAGNTSSEIEGFNVKRVTFYSFGFIDGETLEASQHDEDSMLEAMETEVDGALAVAKLRLSAGLFKTKAGIIGKVSTIAGLVVTLTSPDDIVNISQGMTIGSSTTDGSGSAKATSHKVLTIDEDTSSFTVDSATGLAVDDFIFGKGNYNKQMDGLAAWLPWVKPTTGDNFNGTDRSVSVVRLAGNRLDATGVPLSEALIKGASKANRHGAKISHFLMNDTTFNDLVVALQGKVVYDQVKVGEIGFQTIKIHTSKGTVQCIADRNCPSDLVYGLTLSTWQLRTLGKMVRFFDYGNGKMITMSDADAVEVRCGYRGNLLCKAPGHNIVIRVKAAL